MSLGRAFTVSLLGLTGHIVEVEADLGQSLPNFHLIGLPDMSLQEAKERIRAAAHNAGVPLSRRKITVNLLPASLPKKGSSFDLAIVMAALHAAGDIEDPGRTIFLAELGLDSRLRPINGVLPAVIAALAHNFPSIIVPVANHEEAQLVSGAHVRSYACLGDVVRDFGATDTVTTGLPPCLPSTPSPELPFDPPDLSDIAGHNEARWALEVAAAGRHHMLLTGPPGAGKTMLAERLPGIMPSLNPRESLEVSAIHSLAGTPLGGTLITRAPFERPHHTASAAAIVGGGSGVPRPGAISRAHRGVLFLDEAPEYPRRIVDSLRQPLESGQVVLHRASGTATYPASFQLLMAANPCPCGQGGGKGVHCTCSVAERRRYFHRLSGPILDRVDIQIACQPVRSAHLHTDATETSSTVAARVAQARKRALRRWQPEGHSVNATIPGPLLRGKYRLPHPVSASLDAAMERGALTARGYDRVLRIAWTLADLSCAPQPTCEHVGEALTLRLGAPL